MTDTFRPAEENLSEGGQQTYTLSSGETYWSGKGVGKMWNEIGQLQFDFLLKKDLQPHHKLLDIGCGSLRAGIHFIKYLNSGNYYGIEKEKWLLNAAREVEIPRYGLSEKQVHLLHSDDFNFSAFGTDFDYALAQSVFTHLTLNQIVMCLVNVEKVLKKGGKFFATFFEAENNNFADPIVHLHGGTSYPDRDSFHYTYDVFVELAGRISLEIDYIGEWNHPRDQMMMVFNKL